MSKIRVWGLSRTRRSEEHTSELQSLTNLVCRLLLEKKKKDDVTFDANKHADLLRRLDSLLMTEDDYIRMRYPPHAHIDYWDTLVTLQPTLRLVRHYDVLVRSYAHSQI